jgi:hypothetical protein
MFVFLKILIPGTGIDCEENFKALSDCPVTIEVVRQNENKP